jgi:hypothetical protein
MEHQPGLSAAADCNTCIAGAETISGASHQPGLSPAAGTVDPPPPRPNVTTETQFFNSEIAR